MRKLIAVRQSSQVFSRGKTTFLKPANHRVLAYLRTLGKEQVLCVYNLSSSAQAVELDLQSLSGHFRSRCSGEACFHASENCRSHAHVGPYAFFWFKLRRSNADSCGSGQCAFG